MLFSRSSILTVSLSAFAFLIGAPALANDLNSATIYGAKYTQEDKKDWRVSVGAGVLVVPEYEGADEYEVMALPYIDVNYKDTITLNPYDGLRYHALKYGGFSGGVGLGYDFGRDEDDGDRLRGLGDVDGSIEGQVFLGYEIGQTSAEITFAHDLGDGHEGYTVEADLGHAFFIPQYRAVIRPSISTTFASENYMDSYFGVSNAQASRSRLNAFDAEAGFKDVSVNLFARMPVTEKWSLNAITGVGQLIDDAADSPIVEDETQINGGIFAVYAF